MPPATAAIRSFARAWAVELKDRGIRVNTRSPGAVDTPSSTASSRAGKRQTAPRHSFFSGITPLGCIGRPEEVASAILFLVSDASSYCTGFDLVADERHHAGLSLGRSARGHCAISAKSEQCSNRRHTLAGLPCWLGSFAPSVGPNSVGEEPASGSEVEPASIPAPGGP